LTIGALIYPRMDQIDFTGPFEVLSRIPESTILAIAKTNSPVRIFRGLVLTPSMSIAETPALDVLLVPGGHGQQQLMSDEEVLSLIRNHFTPGRLVFSFCTGALYAVRRGFCADARPPRTGLPGVCSHTMASYPLGRGSSLMATWSLLPALPQDELPLWSSRRCGVGTQLPNNFN
jgi:hypothetical protein